jgi:hypothetical protein
MIGGPWPLPLAAAIVDAGEDVTALRLMNKTPSTRALRILKGIAVTKYAAYATAFAAMTYEAFA